jgi:hypothetical protein
MEKRSGWGAEYSPEKRTVELEFPTFRADKTVTDQETLDRYRSRHKPCVDFVFTLDHIKSLR